MNRRRRNVYVNYREGINVLSGTASGGAKAALTNKKQFGEAFYKTIGALGGIKGHTGGFASGEAGRERARIFGAIGGAVSRKGDAALSEDEKLKIKHAIIKQQYAKVRSSEINKETKQRLLTQKREFERRSREQVARLSDKYGSVRPW